MGKQILFDDNAKDRLLSGMNKAADAITCTYGPKGRNTAFTQQYDVPLVTNDGYTIANQITLSDTFENMGAQILIEAAKKSNELSGDGTTASIVIAKEIINEAYKNIAAGANPVFLKKGMEKAAFVVKEKLYGSAVKDIDNDIINSVATVSGGNDPEIGKIISDIFKELGSDCVVTVEDTQMAETSYNISHGCRIESGYLSRYFLTDDKKNIGEYKAPYIFVVNDEIKEIKQVYKLLEDTVKHDASLIIIAKSVEGEALSAIARNAEKGIVKVAAIKAPGYGDTRDRNLQCIAAITGATLVDPALDMRPENCDLSCCGKAGKVIVEKETTTIEKPASPENETVKTLKKQIEKKLKTELQEYEHEKLSASLGILNCAMAVISVGGTSELEMFERKYRIEDALRAAKHAAKSGVLPGGGKALFCCVPEVKELSDILSGDEKTGALVILNSLSAPIKKIAENCGVSGAVIINTILEKDKFEFGYDAGSETFGDLFKLRVIDPVDVVCNSFSTAASIAGTYITTGAAISEKKKGE